MVAIAGNASLRTRTGYEWRFHSGGTKSSTM